MIKRILLALALATSLGGAVVACNTPASTTSPSTSLPSTAPASGDLASPSSDLMSPEASPASS